MFGVPGKIRMKPSESAYLGSLVPLYHPWAFPPHGCSYTQACQLDLQTTAETLWTTNRHNNRRLRRDLVGDVDVHVNLGGIGAPVGDGLEGGA